MTDTENIIRNKCDSIFTTSSTTVTSSMSTITTIESGGENAPLDEKRKPENNGIEDGVWRVWKGVESAVEGG